MFIAIYFLFTIEYNLSNFLIIFIECMNMGVFDACVFSY